MPRGVRRSERRLETARTHAALGTPFEARRRGGDTEIACPHAVSGTPSEARLSGRRPIATHARSRACACAFARSIDYIKWRLSRRSGQGDRTMALSAGEGMAARGVAAKTPQTILMPIGARLSGHAVRGGDRRIARMRAQQGKSEGACRYANARHTKPRKGVWNTRSCKRNRGQKKSKAMKRRQSDRTPTQQTGTRR